MKFTSRAAACESDCLSGPIDRDLLDRRWWLRRALQRGLWRRRWRRRWLWRALVAARTTREQDPDEPHGPQAITRVWRSLRTWRVQRACSVHLGDVHVDEHRRTHRACVRPPFEHPRDHRRQVHAREAKPHVAVGPLVDRLRRSQMRDRAYVARVAKTVGRSGGLLMSCGSANAPST